MSGCCSHCAPRGCRLLSNGAAVVHTNPEGVEWVVTCPACAEREAALALIDDEACQHEELYELGGGDFELGWHGGLREVYRQILAGDHMKG